MFHALRQLLKSSDAQPCEGTSCPLENAALKTRRGFWGTQKTSPFEGALLKGPEIYEAQLKASLPGALSMNSQSPDETSKSNTTLPSLSRALSSPLYRHVSYAHLDLSGESFVSAELPARIFEQAKLNQCDFSGANLENANFKKAKAKGACFDGANLRRVEAAEADFTSASFIEANLEEANFKKAKLCGANFHKAKLAKTDFTKADLRLANFAEADAHKVIFCEANADGANFQNIKAEGADFSKAQLRGANFERARLDDACFNLADLTDANLKDAIMDRAEMRCANFHRANLTRVYLDEAIADQAIFKDADLTATRFRYASIKDANMMGAKLLASDFLKSDLKNLYAPELYCRLSNFTFAKMEHASLRAGWFDRTDFTNANLAYADFSGSIVEMSKFGGANLCGANLAKAINLEAETLIGANWNHDTQFPEDMSLKALVPYFTGSGDDLIALLMAHDNLSLEEAYALACEHKIDCPTTAIKCQEQKSVREDSRFLKVKFDVA